MRNKLKGFTIIEVTLVLAIAGLIFLMIFVALPALQRQQRDATRKDDIATFISAIKKYQTNNRGAIPTDWGNFAENYLEANFADPGMEDNYEILGLTCDGGGTNNPCTNGNLTEIIGRTFSQNVGTIYVVSQAKCSGNDDVVQSTSNLRKLAILYSLESGGMYCANT